MPQIWIAPHQKPRIDQRSLSFFPFVTIVDCDTNISLRSRKRRVSALQRTWGILHNLLTHQGHHDRITHFTETADVVHLDKTCIVHRVGIFVVQGFAVDEAAVQEEAEASRITIEYLQTAQ